MGKRKLAQRSYLKQAIMTTIGNCRNQVSASIDFNVVIRECSTMLNLSSIFGAYE